MDLSLLPHTGDWEDSVPETVHHVALYIDPCGPIGAPFAAFLAPMG